MFDLGLVFKSLWNLLFFLVLAAISSFWAYRRYKQGSQISLTPVITLNSFMFLASVWFSGGIHDEAVHLHLGWLVSQGLTPFKDFWYHHSPLLWALLSLPLKKFPAPAAIFEFSRLFCAAIFVLNAWLGWQIAGKVWQGKARLSLYLLVLSSVAVSGQFLILRPDIFMTFFLLAGIHLSLEIPGKRAAPAFFAGAAFSLAAGFLIKQYLLVLLPLIAMCMGRRRYIARKLILYILGLATGILPLLSYLYSRGIAGEFIFWVINFNRQIIVFVAALPVPALVMAIWGAYLLFRLRQDPSPRLAVAALVLSTLSALTSTRYANSGYYLACWFFIAAIIASGCPVREALQKIPSVFKRSLAAGVLLASLAAQNLDLLGYSRWRQAGEEKKTFSLLQDYCTGESCFTIMPQHPVFARDATRYYTYSQYLFVTDFPCVKTDLGSGGLAAQVIARRPAVVTCMYKERDFILEIYEKGIISSGEYKRLQEFLDLNYTQRQLGEHTFYLRNDLL